MPDEGLVADTVPSVAAASRGGGILGDVAVAEMIATVLAYVVLLKQIR